MKNLILILTLLVFVGNSYAESASLVAAQVDAQGDSMEEVLSDMESLDQCYKAIEVMNLDSASDEYENAHDQCVNQEYEK